ncbi:DUF1996 domain-containing protein [Streptomyces sp. S.PB5]|uniref:DUF1996 domain-containing protein n=1 Tax=Streptomyces sp. S.PB5 TaxID=3020844 RepID=UPI0025B018E9|nr:DUF1996 domain-containing protein [Streptomyces sp. S.PB5]MDN3027306.1 DUF1996 domain-containing protein [Streptomyces sp. S.PB5]
MLGGGGLVAVNVYASATEGGGINQPFSASWGAGTVACPDVGDALTSVPDEARTEVDAELAVLDQQTAAAYQKLQDPSVQSREAAESGVMDPLAEDRTATIGRIAAALERAGARPDGLDAMAACTIQESEDQAGAQGDDQGDGQGDGAQDGQNQDDQQQGDQQQGDQGQDGQQQGNGGQSGNGPVAADYADITTAPAAAQAPAPGADASRGTFVTSCGVNAGGLFNSDNVIVAPGVSNGAHHFHDYIGNQANNAFADDNELANAGTSCVDQGDKSSYYWPVLRLQNGTQEQDANSPGGGIEGNAGEIVTPKEVTLTFVGNPNSKVTAMPRLLRIITGDAKAFVNGTANANASWSCTGFEDRQLKDKYPLCPQGSDVVRTFKFQSCWDGRNIDSANHRTHVAFAQADGACAAGFQAIPQLVQRIVYDVDAPSLQDGGRTAPLFAVDAFPEQLHKPVTDHGDFINVFDENLMNEMVGCINDGRRCGAGADENDDPGPGNGNGGDEGDGNGSDGGSGQEPGDGSGSGDGGGSGGQPQDEPTPTAGEPTAGEPTADEPTADESTAPAEDEPRTYTSPSATQRPAVQSPEATSYPRDDSTQAASDSGGSTGGVVAQPPAGDGTAPQGGGGSLAETGTQLWPAAAGAVLLVSGFVLLRRTRRRYM